MFPGIPTDILSLSEVHLESMDGSSTMVETIASELGLPHYKCCYQSPSHLDTSKFMGIAVLSKFPIENYYAFRLPNPRLRVTRPNGSPWTTFDKGAQRLTLNVHGKRLTVFNLHYFPFHYFYRSMNDESFKGIRQELVDILLSGNHTPTIITGDFNNKGLSLSHAFPELFAQDAFHQAVVAETTVVGLCEQFDHILYTPETLAVQESDARQNYSDHYAVIADFSFLS